MGQSASCGIFLIAVTGLTLARRQIDRDNTGALQIQRWVPVNPA